jgi:hypothetical protein
MVLSLDYFHDYLNLHQISFNCLIKKKYMNFNDKLQKIILIGFVFHILEIKSTVELLYPIIIHVGNRNQNFWI